jgi:hypothetical protein
MSRRIVIEEPCEHGEMNDHKVGPPVYVNPINIQERHECPGGSRTVLEGLPDDMIERAADALTAHAAEPHLLRLLAPSVSKRLAREVLEAALGLGHDQ